MSVIVTTTEQIARSPINTSPSKQLYSFCKSPRFLSPKSGCMCDTFYNLPSTRERRATSFGYGKRENMGNRQKSPPPNTYTLPSDFSTQGHKGQVFSFGICRDAYAKVYIKAHPAMDRSLPGPGTYEVRSVPGKDTLKYSMRPRTSNPMFQFGKMPGPGTYELLPGISPRGNHFLSKFENSCAPLFSPAHSKRFRDLPKEVKYQPGPGYYPVLQTLSKTGTYFLSRLRSSGCRRFGSEARQTLDKRSSFLTTPGPGTYRAPSEFGEYRAQDKYIEENKRVDARRKSQTKNGRNSTVGGSVAGMTRSSSQPIIDRKGGNGNSAVVDSRVVPPTSNKPKAV